MKIGVLALQGAFIEHIKALNDLLVNAIPIRLPSELNNLDGLIIPGGESTTISKLLSDYQFIDSIKGLIKQGLPVFGTCAGLVLLGEQANGSISSALNVLDITIKRNAYGRQIDSFESELMIPVLGDKKFPGVFIRAPVIQRVGSKVDVLCQLNSNVVAVRQGRVIACSFHPELTDDLRLHTYFLQIITGDVFAEGNR